MTPSAASRAGRGSPASVRARRRARSSSATSVPARSSTTPSSTSSRTPTARPSSRRTSCPLTNADVDVVAGRGGEAAHLQGDRPGPARGRTSATTRASTSVPRSTPSTTRGSTRSSRSCATRTRPSPAVEGRGAQDGDYAVISFVGSRDGEPFEGGTSERMPIILGQERLIPGFEANLHRPRGRRLDRVRHHLPGRLPRDRAGRQARPFRGRAARAAREGPARSRPGLHRDARRLRRPRCAPNRRQGRASSATRSIARATASPTRSSTTRSRTRPSSCPPILVDQEVEVMHDEFRATRSPGRGSPRRPTSRPSRRPMPTCTRSSGPAPRSAFGPCSSCPRSPTPRASTIPDAEVDAEVARGRERYPDDARLQEYFGSDRGRNYIRSTLRRSRVVETLIDEWLAAHPEHEPLPHLEDMPGATHDHDGHDHDRGQRHRQCRDRRHGPRLHPPRCPRRDDVPAPAG